MKTLLLALKLLTVITLGPVLLGISLSVSSYVLAETITNGDGDGSVNLVTRLTPWMLQWVGCTLLYIVLPNTHVRWRDAAAGGLVAALLFEALKFGFGVYIRNFGAYETIYGALSALPVFLVWMYLSWAVILSGAIVAAAFSEWWAEFERRGGTEEDETVALLDRTATDR